VNDSLQLFFEHSVSRSNPAQSEVAWEPGPLRFKPLRQHVWRLAPALTDWHGFRIVFRRTTINGERTLNAECDPRNDRPPRRKRRTGGRTDNDSELAALAKALGHPARVKILRILARQTECICGDVAAELPLAQSTVSQHLKILKLAGLIQGEIDAPRIRYCISKWALERFKTLVQDL
jgi:ArsR family transcriptional regulator